MISPGSVWYEVLELVAILRLQVIRLDRGGDESSASLYLHSSPFGIGFLSDKMVDYIWEVLVYNGTPYNVVRSHTIRKGRTRNK